MGFGLLVCVCLLFIWSCSELVALFCGWLVLRFVVGVGWYFWATLCYSLVCWLIVLIWLLLWYWLVVLLCRVVFDLWCCDLWFGFFYILKLAWRF